MATSPGQRFVRRHNAARSSTSNTTAADIAYDTAVLSEGGYSWASPEVTVDEAGPYLCLFDIGEVQLASTRAVGTLVPSVNTTDQNMYKARHRYLRNSGGNHNVSNGMAVLNLSVNDDVKVRNPGAVDNTDAVGSYATNVNQGGGLQMIRLNDGNFTEVQRTTNLGITITYANATRPWLDSTPTLTQITFTSEVQDDDGLYSGSGGDVTLKANRKYAISFGGTFDGSSSQRHVHGIVLDIAGTNRQYTTGYERNNSSDGPPMQGLYLHEVGGSDETARLYGFVEQEDNTVSNTVNCTDAYMQVHELPDSAEWIHVDNGATDSLTTALAGTTTYYDTPLSSTVRADGDSDLSLDSANDAVQNDSGASLAVLAIGWHKWDRDGGSSGTRKHCWTYWDNGGTRLAYGIGGGYNRGQQGNDDTFQLAYVSAATFDLANGADLSFVVRDPVNAANSDMGVYASDHRYFLGVQVLKLSSLESSGQTASGTPSTPVPTASGAAVVTKVATGTPTMPLLTAAGAALREALANGAPNIPAIVASGAAAREVEAQDGGPNTPIPTAAGTAAIRRDAEGTPTLSIPAAAGAAQRNPVATGTPVLPVPTSAGAADRQPQASGTPSMPVPVSAGAAAREVSADDGNPSLPVPVSAGEARTPVKADGAPSLSVPTASGTAVREASGSGTPGLAAVTGSGAAQADKAASGTPAMPAVTGTGQAERAIGASGTPAVAAVTGTGQAAREVDSSGAVTAPVPVSAGAAAREASASGTPELPAVTAAGDAARDIDASGAPSLPVPEAAGTAGDGITASGSPSLPVPTASGAAKADKLATGAPTLPLPQAAGAADKSVAASGAPEVPVPTSSGLAQGETSAPTDSVKIKFGMIAGMGMMN